MQMVNLAIEQYGASPGMAGGQSGSGGAVAAGVGGGFGVGMLLEVLRALS